MVEKKDTIRFYNQEASGYTKKYYTETTPNSIRLNLILKRFKELKCKTVVDAGCGSGFPVLTFLKNGFNARGFDFSPEMVNVSKDALKKEGYDEKFICYADLEKKVPFNTMKFDGMMMHGPLMHCTDEKQLLTNAGKMLNPDGVILCEARNELMSAFSMNEYSARFYKDLIKFDTLPSYVKEDVGEFYKKLTGFNISAPWVAPFVTRFHNPFTIHKLFEKCGFKFIRFHFAHFHALPPVFEKKYPVLFRERSLGIEDPDDWRGYLMASTFLVEAKVEE